MKTLKLLLTVVAVLLLTYLNGYSQANRECGTISIDDYNTPYFDEKVSGYADYCITWKEHYVRGSEMTGYSINFNIVLTEDESEDTYVIRGTSTEQGILSNGVYNVTGAKVGTMSLAMQPDAVITGEFGFQGQTYSGMDATTKTDF